MRNLAFPHPEPSGPKTRIWPVFLPFHGCKGRCIYCSQTLQSGTLSRQLSKHLADLQADLQAAGDEGRDSLELGFFGGSFTGLPRAWVDRFLELAQSYRDKGLITRVRCSTRPDMLDSADLRAFRQAGLDMVEVGVQSFSDTVLQSAGRGYTRYQALQGIERVRKSGLKLGVQLLPGLPGHSRKEWLQDIRITSAVAPETVRLYPCLVLEGTPLARLWRSGGYRPWSLGETVSALSRGVSRFWRKGIRVIRIGLPAQAGLAEHVLAGPWHASLGNIIRSRVLRARVQAACLLLGPGPKRLVCPEAARGEIWGYRGGNRKGLQALGLSRERVRFEEGGPFRLEKV